MPTLAELLSQKFGYDPNIQDRPAILPDYRPGVGFVAPEMAVGLAKALMLPGHAMKGGEYTYGDATDAALNIGGIGGGVSAMIGGVPKGALGAHVWQGGPHKCGPEGAAKSLEHIGKGEGAQAYGWGRYDAGAREVAEQYGENLSRPNLAFQNGMKIEAQPDPRAGNIRYTNAPDDPVMNTAINVLDITNGDISAALKRLDPFNDEDVIDLLGYWQANPTKAPSFDKGKYVYKHDLPDDAIARYLDWDKPLSEQPDAVQKAIMNLPTAHKIPESMTGAQFYESSHLVPGEYKDPRAASRALQKLGIPGLKYLDGMSRGKGKGSHNYVTWDQDVLNRMKLLERNGVPVEQLDANGTPLLSALLAQQGGE